MSFSQDVKDELETQIGNCVVEVLVEIMLVYIFQICVVRCEFNLSLLCHECHGAHVGFFTIGIL